MIGDMTRMKMRRLVAASLLCLAMPPALAWEQPATNSRPVAAEVAPGVPSPKDVAWPGGMIRLEVDATDTERRIVRVRQSIPLGAAKPGERKAGVLFTLLLPEWLPGNHAPRGEIAKLAGLRFTADGKPVGWRRDPFNVYAFHLDLPDDAGTVVAEFQYLASIDADEGRVKITDTIMNLQWENLALYPAGYYVRRLPVEASVTYPAGWTAHTALRGKRQGDTVHYAATDFETLIDSPVFAGAHVRSHDLGRSVALHVFADETAELDATADQVAAHKKLVDEAIALFGARPFDHYDFLLALSNGFGRIGLEHHRSSENALPPGYFRRWNDGPGGRNLLPHELVHSWNGKHRRPEGLWTPDFATPMRDDLLWVYEGQTQFWGYVLGARSGIYTKAQTLDALASIAAGLDTVRGRDWRPVSDTTRDPIVAARRPKAWPDWQRSEDYYNEGMLVWLEADAIIRRGTGGRRGLDDFARGFFGGADGDWGVRTYSRADVVAALNAVFPHDWDVFLAQRIDGLSNEVTKGGFTLGGYRLGYGDTPGPTIRGREVERRQVDQSYGIGLVIKDDGEIVSVGWDSPGFKAGLTSGDRVLAIADMAYTRERFLAALRDTARPIRLLVRRGERFTTITLDYSGGIRYPRLDKTGEGEGSLDRLLAPRTR